MLKQLFCFLLACSIVLILIEGCVEKTEKTTEAVVREVQIDTLYAFTTFDEHNIAQPSDILILENRVLAIVDFGQKTITLVQSNGELITSFGREGKGPGEFVRIQQLFETNGTINIVDSDQKTISRFNYHGDLKDSFIFQAPPTLPDGIVTINDSLYAAGTGGDENSLIAIRNINQDSSFYFGQSKTEGVESIDFLKSVTQLKNGEIPDFFKNMVTLRSDGTYLYAYLNAFSELHKYDLQGNLIWQKEIDLPYNKEIFNSTVETAKNTAANALPFFNFILDIKTHNQETFILSGKKTSDGPQLLVKVSQDGKITDIITLPDHVSTLNGFDIHPESNTAYFSSSGDGVVYKTEILFNK